MKNQEAELPAGKMRKASSGVYTGFLFLILPWAAASAEYDRALQPDVWALTRQSSVVVLGAVSAVDSTVTAEVIKGLKPQLAPATVAFPRPAVPNIQPTRFIRDGPRVLKFTIGESWFLFLQTNQPAVYALLDAVPGTMIGVEQAIRDVLELDSLPNDPAKCSFLVRLINYGQGLSAGLAAREIETLNTPGNLGVFAGLERTNAFAMLTYIRLLDGNANPEALPILRGFLKTADRALLPPVIDALARKEVTNAAVSEELRGFIDHPDVVVREHAIFALERRDYFEAFPTIVRCLEDPNPSIRAIALTWPWYAYVGKHAEVLPRIRVLTRDRDEFVRSSACKALVGARDLAPFYPLWFMSVFDRSVLVRHTVHLDLLLEHSPFVCAGLLLWPTLCAVAWSWAIARRLPRESRLRSILAGIVVGYALGVVGGALIGMYRATNPLVHALFLAPAVTVPITVLLTAIAVALRWGHLADGARCRT